MGKGWNCGAMAAAGGGGGGRQGAEKKGAGGCYVEIKLYLCILNCKTRTVMKRMMILMAAMLAVWTTAAQDTAASYAAARQQLNDEGKTLGVALCGGSAFGYAHLGFLQALDEAGCG